VGNTVIVDYTLGEVPKPLARRASVAITVTMGCAAVVLMIVVLHLEGVRFSAPTWLTLAAIAGVVSAVMAWLVRTISPEERAILRAAQRRTLPPLDPRPATGSLQVRLQPGPIWRRRIEARSEAGGPAHRSSVPDVGGPLFLEADQSGLSLPNWLVEGREKRVAPYDRTVVRWDAVTRFRVRSDSDGPDLFEITAADADGSRALVRVRRREITDEIALLDYVRSVGQTPVDLEASIGVAEGTAGDPRRQRANWRG